MDAAVAGLGSGGGRAVDASAATFAESVSFCSLAMSASCAPVCGRLTYPCGSVRMSLTPSLISIGSALRFARSGGGGRSLKGSVLKRFPSPGILVVDV